MTARISIRAYAGQLHAYRVEQLAEDFVIPVCQEDAWYPERHDRHLIRDAVTWARLDHCPVCLASTHVVPLSPPGRDGRTASAGVAPTPADAGGRR